MTITVRTISSAEHLEWVGTRSSVSFLQLPSWGAVKSDWTHESIGFFDGSTLRAAALVLYRQIPRVQRYLAYLPEGPELPWTEVIEAPAAWMGPLVEHLRAHKAFTVKIGPRVVSRVWETQTIKDALAAGPAEQPISTSPRRLGDLPADEVNVQSVRLIDTLRAHGWKQDVAAGGGFGDVQPRYVFQIPLNDRTLDEVFASFNQLWRRNIRKAEKAGVDVTVGQRADLDEFHSLYVETAARDRFTPRPLSYFQRMWDAMHDEDADRLRLYLARHEGQAIAATTLVTVGDHAWYSYGASSTSGRDLRPSNAIQWQMICDAHRAGAHTYDLRGISDTLDPDDHLFGLLQFKLGTGGRAVEHVGELDLPINALLHRAVTMYLARSGKMPS